MNRNYIYQVVHTLSHHPLHVDAHCRLLERIYMDVYFKPLYLDSQQIDQDIIALLKRERVTQELSVFVEIRINRNGDVSLFLSEVSIYDGYTLRCISPSVETILMELPFGAHHTSIRREILSFANDVVHNLDCDMAIECSIDGCVQSIGGGTAFGIVDDRTIIASTSFQSVERQIVIEAARDCQYKVIESRIMRNDLRQFNELFFCDHYGVTAISRYAQHRYLSINAQKIAEQLATPWISDF